MSLHEPADAKAVVASPWRTVATLDDLWDGQMKAVEVDGLAVVLINVGGDVYAYEDQCPHLGSRLSAGCLEGADLTCASHEWVFDCRLGRGINPATARLRPIPVRVAGEEISLITKGAT
jgi:toluene monooxygenase system ferredoxin subunit